MEEFNKEIESDERAVEKLASPTKRTKADKGTTVNEWDLRNIPDMWKKGTLSRVSGSGYNEYKLMVFDSARCKNLKIGRNTMVSWLLIH